MYSEHIQDFIQRHIDLIDKEDWTKLLRLTMGPDDLDFLTNVEVQELIDTLAEAGILIKGETRLRILFDIIKEALEVYFENNEQGNIFFFLHHYLENYLGLTQSEAFHFINMNMEDLDIRYDDQGVITRRT